MFQDFPPEAPQELSSRVTVWPSNVLQKRDILLTHRSACQYNGSSELFQCNIACTCTDYCSLWHEVRQHHTCMVPQCSGQLSASRLHSLERLNSWWPGIFSTPCLQVTSV